jgi:hypothetical protein
VSVGEIEFTGSIVCTEPQVGGEYVPFMFDGVEFGGLSGIVCDSSGGVYHVLSDDKSENDPARFSTIDIDLSDGRLDEGDLGFVGGTFLRDMKSRPFELDSLDLEGFEMVGPGRPIIGSERDGAYDSMSTELVCDLADTGEPLDNLEGVAHAPRGTHPRLHR